MTVLRLEVAGVAGVHPAVAELGPGRVLVAVEAREHAARSGDDFADAVLVGVLDADFGVVEGRADGVEVDVVGRVDGVGPGELGLAVELTQRHAHGEEEAEGLGTERRASGRRRRQVGEAEPVLERAKEDGVGQPRAPAAIRSALGAELHAEVEHHPLEPGRVHHPRADIGGDPFPGPRAEQDEARADLAQIGHHRFLVLDEIHA